jgi:hypothetical protein
MSAASNDLKSDPKETTHSSWRNLLTADLIHYAREAKAFQNDRPGRLRAISILLTPSLMCCALHRRAHAAFRRGWIDRRARSQGLTRSSAARSSIPRRRSAPVSTFRTPQGCSFKALPARTYPCILLLPSPRESQCHFPAVAGNFVQGSETTYR